MILQRLAIVFFAISVNTAFSQATLPIPRNIESAYSNKTRTIEGVPGKNYWQNTASYNIDVNFNPTTEKISGTVEVDYTNNSPDTLRQIWFKLYPNLYKKGSIRTMPVKPEDLTDGVNISSFQTNHTNVDIRQLIIDGTNMHVNIPRLLPQQSVHFSIAYSYLLNKTSHIRTGEVEPGAAFVAYFFPRIAVYDDIDGWNRYPYNGTQEFYNDFCNFNVSVTVPNGYVVWGTGDLTNTTEVLNEKYESRIDAALRNDAVTDIIDSNDVKAGNITRQNPFNTWKFAANNVTDFVFAASNHYVWKASGIEVDPITKRRTRVDAVFNPQHKDYYEVIDFARKTIWNMSYVFPKWPYPYQHETVFDGLDQMEYPMMVNDNPLENRMETITLTDHEIFHTMFPFYMGINETKYAWMDEGWATVGEWLISRMIDTSIVDDYGINFYEMTAGKEADLPIITLSTETNYSYFTNSYPKPALGYLFVKDMLGDSLFVKALHYYIEQWKGKHPTPYDFFSCMNAGAGINLNWFWKKWFFENGVPNLAIKNVTQQTNAVNIIVQNKGEKPVPVELTCIFENGTLQKIHRNISVWAISNTATIVLPTKNKITKVILGGTYVPDISRKDNIWQAR